jgi:small-conductance mechanosensitive channel
MQWREWLNPEGAFPISIDYGSVIVAVTVIAGAGWLGWLARRWIGPRLATALGGRADGAASASAQICFIVQYSLTALILLVAAHAVVFGTVALLLVAAALSAAAALLMFHVMLAARLGRAAAFLLAITCFVATLAGMLGGMQALVSALDTVRFAVGRREFTLLSIINLLVVVALLFLGARIVNRIATHSIAQLNRLDVSQKVLVQKLASLGVVAVAILLGIDLLGIDLTALAFFSGALGLAVGFGLQKTFGNLIAGLILLMDRSIKPGDVIVVADTFGQVSKIGVRAVSVITRDGKEHLIPNEQLMTEEVENWSYSSRDVRVHIPVGVAYSSDMTLAQRLMVEAASASARVLAQPRPSVWMKAFGENSVDHDILIWISDPEAGVGNVRSEILNRLWTLFAEHGIEIPFPQRDVHIRSTPAVDQSNGVRTEKTGESPPPPPAR